MALRDWQLTLFPVIPPDNVVAGILFAVIAVISPVVFFMQ